MKQQNFDFTGGLNFKANPFAQPQGTLRVCNGVDPYHRLGALLKDTGYAKAGTGLETGKDVLGLHDFRQDASTQKMLATMDDATSDDTQLFYRTTGNWTEIADAETAWANKAGVLVEMEDFIGHCFMVGYSPTDGFIAPASLTGTTFSTSANVTSMPSAKYVIRYRDRLYVSNCYISPNYYPYRTYASDIPSGGAITWTPATNFIDVDYSEGTTGLGQNWDRLMIFTEKSAYMYDQSQRKKVWDQGGYHRTIQNSGPYMFFANRNGVFVSTGGQPENISLGVVDAFRQGNPSSWRSAMVDEQYMIHVGNVTLDGISYQNCLLTFNINGRGWKTRELGDAITSMASVLRSGQEDMYLGGSGFAYRKGKHTDSTPYVSDSSDGTASGTGAKPIHSNFELAPIFVQGADAENRIGQLSAYADRAMGLNLRARAVDRNSRVLTEYRRIGQCDGFISSFDVAAKDGVLLQVAGSEYGSNPYWSLYGLSYDIMPVSEPNKKD